MCCGIKDKQRVKSNLFERLHRVVFIMWKLVILGIIKFICTFSRIVLFLHKNKKLLVYENERAVDR